MAIEQTLGWFTNIGYVILIVAIIVEIIRFIGGGKESGMPGGSFSDIGRNFQKAFVGEKGIQKTEERERFAESQLENLTRVENQREQVLSQIEQAQFKRLALIKAELEKLYASVLETERMGR